LWLSRETVQRGAEAGSEAAGLVIYFHHVSPAGKGPMVREAEAERKKTRKKKKRFRNERGGNANERTR